MPKQIDAAVITEIEAGLNGLNSVPSQEYEVLPERPLPAPPPSIIEDAVLLDVY